MGSASFLARQENHRLLWTTCLPDGLGELKCALLELQPFILVQSDACLLGKAPSFYVKLVCPFGYPEIPKRTLH